MLAMVERDLKAGSDKEKVISVNVNTSEWADMHTLRFKHTQLLGIDIDDKYHETNVQAVLNHFKGKVSAAYYSFSHGRANDKGGTENRYRLLFQLDKSVSDYEAGKELIKIIRDEFLVLYPEFLTDKIDVMNPKTLWHGSSRPPIFIDESAYLDTDEYMVKVEKVLSSKREIIKKRREIQKKSFSSSVHNPISFDELYDMAHVIGHIPSGSGRYDEWIDVCHMIKSHEWAGGITEDEGLQLFHIISGGESADDDYLNLRPNGELNIGSFIRKSSNLGHVRKKYAYAQQHTQETIEIENIKVKKYLDKELVKGWISRKQRLIIDSPTGSGKTTAVMNAFKDLKSIEHKYYLFAVPTIALAEQVAAKHNATVSKGNIKEFERYIKGKAALGERIFVTTFDKSAIVVDCLLSSYPEAEIHFVVDEAQEYTSSRGFRPKAIEALSYVESTATSFLALSGTPRLMLKDSYDKMIKVDNGLKGSPCMNFRVLTYHNRKFIKEIPFQKLDGTTEMLAVEEEDTNFSDAAMVSTIRSLLKDVRVICYINDFERIKRIAELLRRAGYKVETLNTDSKQSATYRNIIENEAIADDVQVVLTTVVLASGVTIKNESSKWACIVAADHQSKIFSPSLIKQISHRFRNPYQYLILYMREQDPEGRSDKPFYIETAYQHRLFHVERYVKYLNAEYKEENVKDFIPSNVERQYGIFYKSADPDARIEFDKKYVRFMASKDKENYYNGNRQALIKQVEREIGLKLGGTLNVNDELRLKGIALDDLLEVLQEGKEERKLESDELRSNFEKYFNEEVYDNFNSQKDNPALERFRDLIHPDQFSAVSKISQLVDYENARLIVGAVKNRNDTNKYVNDIRALCEIASFDYLKKVTVTEKVSRELLKYCGKTYTSADFKTIVDEVIPKRLKISKADVKSALKLFHTYKSRNENERLTTIYPLSIENISKVRHIPKDKKSEVPPINEEVIKNSIVKYIATRSKQQQKVLYPAVEKKYGAVKNEEFEMNWEDEIND